MNLSHVISFHDFLILFKVQYWKILLSQGKKRRRKKLHHTSLSSVGLGYLRAHAKYVPSCLTFIHSWHIYLSLEKK